MTDSNSPGVARVAAGRVGALLTSGLNTMKVANTRIGSACSRRDTTIFCLTRFAFTAVVIAYFSAAHAARSTFQ